MIKPISPKTPMNPDVLDVSSMSFHDEDLLENCEVTSGVSDLENVVFEECRMQRSDMQQSRVVLSEFRQCNLKEFQMHGTPARGLDFSTCDIDGLGIRTEELSGATVSPEQAVYLARKIGLIVKT